MTQRAGLGTDNPQSTASQNEKVNGTESQASTSPPTAPQNIVLQSSQGNLSTRDKPLDVINISPAPSTARKSFVLPSSQHSILQNYH